MIEPENIEVIPTVVLMEGTVAERDERMLKLLRHHGAKWHTTFELGGRDASHHSHTLRRLWKRGLVERRPAQRYMRYWEWRIAQHGTD